MSEFDDVIKLLYGTEELPADAQARIGTSIQTSPRGPTDPTLYQLPSVETPTTMANDSPLSSSIPPSLTDVNALRPGQEHVFRRSTSDLVTAVSQGDLSRPNSAPNLEHQQLLSSPGLQSPTHALNAVVLANQPQFHRLFTMCDCAMFASEPPQHVNTQTLWNDAFTSVHGLDECKKIVYDNVVMPKIFPDHYVRTRMPFHLALVAPNGAGKRTLLRTTCQTIRINYVKLKSWVAGLLTEAIAFAQLHQPCLIHFDNKYGEAFERATDSNTPQFVHEYEQQVINSNMYKEWGMVWLAFSLTRESSLQNIMLLETVQERVGRYQQMGSAELSQYIRNFVRHYHGGNLDNMLGNDHYNMQLLVQAMVNKTPAQIENFFRRVYYHRLKRATPTQLVSMAPDDVAPTWVDDFIPCMRETDPRSEDSCVSSYVVPEEYRPYFMDCDNNHYR